MIGINCRKKSPHLSQAAQRETVARGLLLRGLGEEGQAGTASVIVEERVEGGGGVAGALCAVQ